MAATLESIGTTLGVGFVIMILSILGFFLAVKKRSVLIAPRAYGRPRNVIYNPHPSNECQDRGSAALGWVKWTLGLTFDTMIHGVPGTGTREGGLAGYMLKVNMDGIMMLRFHALGLRVSAVAAFLFVSILLPCYYTAQCWGDGAQVTECDVAQYNLTNYERITIANVPSVTKQSREEGVNGSLARLYASALCFGAVVLVTIQFLKQEWVEILAMRRVYYLERDIWEERKDELQVSLFYDEVAREEEGKKQHFSFEEEEEGRSRRQANNEMSVSIGRREYLDERDPWIPHPEQRDTVPNISLYSLLVGGLPSLPFEAIEDLDTEAAIDYSKRQSLDWQLGVATTFFDHCVPNQPGFSSSVAAVTIIPGSKDMAEAWRKWYCAAAKLRRLRFIRQQIAERRHYEIDVDEEDGGKRKEGEDLEISEEAYLTASQLQEDDILHYHSAVPLASSESNLPPSPRPVYRHLSKRKSYFRKVLGTNLTQEEDHYLSDEVAFGPEQASVYSREFAQAAAACCPNGCREDRVRKARIDELLEMEREAAEECHLANLELNEVRRDITHATNKEHGAGVDLNDLTASKVSRLRNDLDLESKIWQKSKSDNQIHSKSLDSAPSRKARPSEVQVPSRGTNDQPPLPPRDNNPLTCDVRAESTHSRSSLHHMEGSRKLVSPSWQHVEDIVNVNSRTAQGSYGTKMASSERTAEINSGMWAKPSLRSLKNMVSGGFKFVRRWIAQQSVKAVDSVARESTYAIVTFTSRQAAVAARHCLADGRGGERWLSVRNIPTPPLADAPACDVKACRNCLRPVSISITQRQKNCRKIAATVILFCVYVFYTIPLAFATSIVSADNLDEILPPGLLKEYKYQISGLLSAGIYALFFSTCPLLFKAISNFGSGAVSAAQAELRALQYYWWFMLLTAFSANLLATMTINAINNGLKFGNEVRVLIVSVANSIPKSTAFTWLNWILLRFTITLPVNYLLTINSFLFAFLRLPCCTRAVTGGGPGGPTPYRIFVDSGVVLLCTFALAPASPLVALAAFFYFLVCTPLWRRNLIFMYRPKFDAGGARWVFVYDMIISSITTGIVLLTAQLALKSAIGPAVIAALPIIPTFMYNWHVEARYKPAFNDAALLQTSLLDGWDTSSAETSAEQREDFRRFLVDAHKAAYVPVCLAGPELDGFITAEPAVALPTAEKCAGPDTKQVPDDVEGKSIGPRAQQHGATLRRSGQTPTNLLRMRKSAASCSPSGMNPVEEGEEGDDLSQPLQESEKPE